MYIIFSFSCVDVAVVGGGVVGRFYAVGGCFASCCCLCFDPF
jgi:hypothetical protein